MGFVYGISTGDFNADGDVDLAVADLINAAVRIYEGRGDGTFDASGAYPMGASPAGVLATDINGDSRDDIVSANGGDATVGILTNEFPAKLPGYCR